jgi:hypothetical protein
MREILLPGVVMVDAVAGLRADVVDEDLQVHLRLAAETLHVGQEVTLVGADGTAHGVVVLKGGAKPERKDSGTVKAAGDDAGVISGSSLGFSTGQACGVLVEMLRDDDGQIGCGKEEDLVSEEAGDPREGHRTAVTG